jgi:hypothetical protein
MPVIMLMHTLPHDRDDYGSVFARPSRPRDRDDDYRSGLACSSKPHDCTCDALSPNALHHGERCAACPFAIRMEK